VNSDASNGFVAEHPETPLAARSIDFLKNIHATAPWALFSFGAAGEIGPAIGRHAAAESAPQ
jgi:hypothetical protein